MLNWSFVLQRLKEELSLPFQTIEMSDEEIVDYCKRNSLKLFQQYFPQKWRLTLNCADPTVIVPNRASEFYLIEPDDREILNLVEFIPTLGPMLMNGHPWLGPWTFDAIPEWALATFKATNLKPFSNYNYTHEFIPPNQVRISPKFSGACVFVYERSHDPELSTLPPDLQNTFINLCFGQLAMRIGRIRKKFTNYNTPFGEIQVNGEDLFNDGKEVYDKTIDEMKNGSAPNVVFDYG